MLSEQCARLRSWAAQFDDRADLDALAPLLARDLREAADTIISLRDRLQAAELGSGICKPTEPARCLDGTDCPAWLCSECGELFELGANFCSNCGAKVVGK